MTRSACLMSSARFRVLLNGLLESIQKVLRIVFNVIVYLCSLLRTFSACGSYNSDRQASTSNVSVIAGSVNLKHDGPFCKVSFRVKTREDSCTLRGQLLVPHAFSHNYRGYQKAFIEDLWAWLQFAGQNSANPMEKNPYSGICDGTMNAKWAEIVRSLGGIGAHQNTTILCIWNNACRAPHPSWMVLGKNRLKEMEALWELPVP
ncbi:hypothetical protein BDR05DRAFT_947118 [Suillus weaverae]|nr:hypothetical protein BDR05DRAFT_947118 [Suillus weaverae]